MRHAHTHTEYLHILVLSAWYFQLELCAGRVRAHELLDLIIGSRMHEWFCTCIDEARFWSMRCKN